MYEDVRRIEYHLNANTEYLPNGRIALTANKTKKNKAFVGIYFYTFLLQYQCMYVKFLQKKMK